MAAHLTKEQRQLVFRLHHRGLSTSAIAKEVGMTSEGMRVVLRGQKRDGWPDEWTSSRGRLSVREREPAPSDPRAPSSTTRCSVRK